MTHIELNVVFVSSITFKLLTFILRRFVLGCRSRPYVQFTFVFDALKTERTLNNNAQCTRKKRQKLKVEADEDRKEKNINLGENVLQPVATFERFFF